MPEGPEIRREAATLARVLVGKPLVRIEYRVPRLAERARTLCGARVASVSSRGKALLIAYSNGLTHYSHNQLYGKWQVLAAGLVDELPAKRASSIRVRLDTATHVALLFSSTQIELLTRSELAAHPFLQRLGPDVLDRATTVASVSLRLRDPAFARRSLAALLLDQRFLAGLGNYLRSDILHAAKLRHAMRPIDLPSQTLARLAGWILALPRQSLRTGGATNDPHLVRELAAQGVAREDRRFRVYGREGLPCWACRTRIRRVDVGGRGIYYCPRCQPANA